MEELIDILRTRDGLALGLVIFSSGIGIGACVVQINSILRRQANDAVTSVITWVLLGTFSLVTSYYLWHTSENVILPLLIGTLAVSSAVGLAASIAARQRLAEVEEARRQPSETDLLQSASALHAAFALRGRLRAARAQRGPAAG